uniref:Uncharacterized protein n=1 Tax=Setaria italica TaxID=4555 RepID=K3Y4H5_SETIT
MEEGCELSPNNAYTGCHGTCLFSLKKIVWYSGLLDPSYRLDHDHGVLSFTFGRLITMDIIM